MNDSAGMPRVVSLLPSATEIVALLGAGGLLVGRSHECDFPPDLADRPVLTAARTTFTSARDVDQQVRTSLAQGESLYHLDAERLQQLHPDIIITQDLCAVCSIDLNTVRKVAGQMQPAPQVVSLNPLTLEGVLDDILTVGRVIGRERQARDAIVQLRERLDCAMGYVSPFEDPNPVLFLEWTDPLYCAGHWTAQMIGMAGGRTLGDRGASRRIEIDEAVALAPEHVVIAPCGLTLAQAMHEAKQLMAEEWFRALPAVKNHRVAVVDGNQMFNRPGPRLVDALEWLVGFVQEREELMPKGFPWARLTG
ncbi:MAG: ABC transporter substrate-binding protein [Phycisphaerales bacterium]|nr:ABC transporter substrate-binding protein [Phycisphaerales bacterium]